MCYAFIFVIYSSLLFLPSSASAQNPEGSNSTQANTTSSSSPTQWVVYTNDKFGFSIEYPQSWIVEEKQNRFEIGLDLVIKSPEFPSNDGAFTFSISPPPPTNNITELTDRSIEAILGGFDVDYDRRLIDDTNVTKYKIDEEPAGAFTYVIDKKDLNYTTPIPFGAVEQVITIHNGDGYSFEFTGRTDNFDDPTLTNVRQHMFNSIKWLN